MRILIIIFILVCPAIAQTSISIPTAAGGGIKYTINSRFGINYDQCDFYGNQQYCANLLQAFNTHYAPAVGSMFSYATSCGSTTSWTDSGNFAPNYAQPSGFWNTANVEIISGSNLGYTGTVTASTGTPSTLTLSPPMTTPCSAGDYLRLNCPTVGSSCGNLPVLGTFTADLTSGQQTIANVSNTSGLYNGSVITCGGFLPGGTTSILVSGTTVTLDNDATSTVTGTTCTWNNLSYAVTGTPSIETNDLSTDPLASGQAMINTSPFSETIFFDSPLNGSTYINMNGTYVFQYRAKASSSGITMNYSVAHGCATLLTGTDTLTTSWANYTHVFTPSETGSQGTCAGELQFSSSAGTVKVMDPSLHESGAGGNTTTLRNATYAELQNLRPGTLRMMESPQFGCPLSALLQPSQLQPQCFSDQYQAPGLPISMGLNDQFYNDAVIGADPFWTLPPYLTTTEIANLQAYINAPCSSGNAYATIRCNYLAGTAYAGMAWTDIFRHIYLESGNEMWNGGNADNLSRNSQAYAYILAAAKNALHGSPYYNAKVLFGGSGHSGYTTIPNAGSWNDNVMSQAQTYGGSARFHHRCVLHLPVPD
jgi:hypothetical protein